MYARLFYVYTLLALFHLECEEWGRKKLEIELEHHILNACKLFKSSNSMRNIRAMPGKFLCAKHCGQCKCTRRVSFQFEMVCFFSFLFSFSFTRIGCTIVECSSIDRYRCIYCVNIWCREVHLHGFHSIKSRIHFNHSFIHWKFRLISFIHWNTAVCSRCYLRSIKAFPFACDLASEHFCDTMLGSIQSQSNDLFHLFLSIASMHACSMCQTHNHFIHVDSKIVNGYSVTYIMLMMIYINNLCTLNWLCAHQFWFCGVSWTIC